MRQILFLCLFTFSANGIAAPKFNFSGTHSIYGVDDREFVSKHSSKKIQELSRSVALIVSSDIVEKNFLKTLIKATTLSDLAGLCSDENFAKSRALSGCTGFLVGPKTLVTAGHCFQVDGCTNKKIIFDVDAQKQVEDGYRVNSNNVFGCTRIIHHKFEGMQDYAVIELDRAPKNRPFLKLNRAGLKEENNSVFTIGHPLGQPLMHSKSTPVIMGANEWEIGARLDAFQGNSGSPVFNAETFEVEGILVNGQGDFFPDAELGCSRNMSYDEDQGGEGIFKASKLPPF